MRRIESRIDTGSASRAENQAAYEAMVATLGERQQIAIDGGHGRERSIERHLSRGKVLVRDRIDMVTDHESAFLEFSTLSGFGQYDDEVPGGGIVTGIGIVHGVPWVFIANGATVKGGSPSRCDQETRAGPGDRRGERSRRDLPRRLRWRVPSSAGRNLSRQGSLRRRLLPSNPPVGKAPQLSVVLGGCTADGATSRRSATR